MKSSADYAGYDDESLLRLIAELQEEALTQLYERYSRVIFNLTLAIVRDHAMAEEITLDVFMRVWQKAHSYRADRAQVSTWLTHIARYHAIDMLRRRSVRPDQYAVHWDEGVFREELPEQDPQESVELSLRRERVHAGLARLPAEQGQVLILAYFGGYTQRQIAEMLREPLGTVKTRLRLAMQKLRDFLGDEQRLPDRSIPSKKA